MIPWEQILALATLAIAVVMMILNIRERNSADKSIDSANTERLVRIEDTTKTTASELIKLNVKLELQEKAQHKMDTRLAITENSLKEAHTKINEHSDRLDILEKEHWMNIDHREGTN